MSRKQSGLHPIYLGLEGGGTRTVALWSDSRGRVIRRREFGALNFRLASDGQALAVLRSVRRAGPARPTALAVCLAGFEPGDRARVRGLIGRVFPGVPCLLGTDLDSGLAAAFGLTGDGILIIGGTGSCVVGRRTGQRVRVGGRGHLLGDQGSAYWLALTGLRQAMLDFDRSGRVRPALRRVLRRLHLRSPDELVKWIHAATKADVAGLVGEVIRRDPALMSQGASFLAQDCAAVARRLEWSNPVIAVAGGLLRHHRAYHRCTLHQIRQTLPHARIIRLRRESAYGAVLRAMS